MLQPSHRSGPARALVVVLLCICAVVVTGDQPAVEVVANYPEGVTQLGRLRIHTQSKKLVALTLVDERVVVWPLKKNGTAPGTVTNVPPAKNELVGLVSSSVSNSVYAMTLNDTVVKFNLDTLNYTTPTAPYRFETEVFALALSKDESEIYGLRDGFLDKMSLAQPNPPSIVTKGNGLTFSYDMRWALNTPQTGLFIARGGQLFFFDLQTSKLRIIGTPNTKLSQPWAIACHPGKPLIYVVTSDKDLMGIEYNIAIGNSTYYTYARGTTFNLLSFDVSQDGQYLYIADDSAKQVLRIVTADLVPEPPLPSPSPTVSPVISPGTSPQPTPNGTSPTPVPPSPVPSPSYSPEPFQPAKRSWFERQRGLAIALIVVGSSLLVGIATLVMWRISRLPREPSRGPLLHQQPEAVSYEGF